MAFGEGLVTDVRAGGQVVYVYFVCSSFFFFTAPWLCVRQALYL